jgi:hypothetical protein
VPELILPRGVEVAAGPRPPEQPSGVLIDNRTDLPDELVQGAVQTYFVENSSLVGANMANTFQTYAAEGSLLARSKFRTPANVYDEIKLARDLVDRDDDVRAVIGLMIAVAFSDGMENHHPDEKTVTLFNGLAAHMNLDAVLKRMYREYLIAQQVTTVALFTRRQSVDVGEGETEAMVAPLIGVLPAERIRTIGSDLFGNADLAYLPEPALERWLSEYFDDAISAARKAELRRQDPVAAVMFTGKVKIGEKEDLTGVPVDAYRLNPRMVHRSKAASDDHTPRPLMTANFALLEAKRLLNLMDFALLQGGMNFIVVAKKGTDERPAQQPEIENLKQVVRTASRTGVIVGDHRLTFEIITPNLDALLAKDKRQLLGRKIAMTLLRLPETNDSGSSGAATEAELEFIARVITSDRNDLRRHVENDIYEEAAKRNNALTNGTPRIWFPKIVLQGTQYFTDYVLKLRDRGDIPRKTAVEAGGFDWEAGVEQRKRELKENIDDTMAPAGVPFTSADAGPQDNNNGRPVGSSPNNGRPGAQQGPGRDPAAPRRTITRNAGETVRAVLELEEETGEQITRRVGERTYAILEEYPDRTVGRITGLERDALAAGKPVRNGPVAVVPVNPGYEVGELKAVRLAPGVSMLVGARRTDQAIVAKALCFREPEFDLLGAEETALRWGFPIEGWDEPEEEQAQLAPAARPELAPGPTFVLQTAGRTRRIVLRDKDNNVIGSEEVPVEGDRGD